MDIKSEDPFAPLSAHGYVSVITFRKTGAPVATAIWFFLENGRLYGYSAANAGKVKRMRATRRVQVAPCDARGSVKGPYIEAVGRLLPPEEGERADKMLTHKYGLSKRLLDFFASFRPKNRAYFELTPAEDAGPGGE